ncbi:serine protease [Patulibacter sp. NPDC049589]|uniref:serine protease n=1 Tax=Patulibacter sp. NPDC049589 TaxID=3154731 RepID=UPI003428D392
MSVDARPLARARRLTLLAVVAGAAAVVPSAAADAPLLRTASTIGTAPAAPRIVGGSPVAITAVPYQVRIRVRGDGQPWGTPGPFSFATCGGAVIAPDTILTAAHCTFAGVNRIPPASFVVDSGFSRLDPTPGAGGAVIPQAGDTAQTRSVADVRRHPRYRSREGDQATLAQLTDDVAVLRLAAPLRYDAATQPVALPAPGQSPLGTARVSGYGVRSGGGTQDGGLYALDVPLLDAAIPEAKGGAGELNALYAVTRSRAGSTCQGDSGGPVVQAGTIVGIVSSGAACGAGQSGFHTNVAAPEVLRFVQGEANPPLAPVGGEGVALRAPTSTPRTGDTLTCSPGSWTNAPTFTFAFTDTRDGTTLQSGPATYLLKPADAGRTVACTGYATTAGGVGRTPQTPATPAVIGGAAPAAARTRLRLALRAPAVVRRGGSIRVEAQVRNVGGSRARGVRTCVTPGARFVVAASSGGVRAGGRRCWRTSSVRRATTKTFRLRVRAGARSGPAPLVTGTATATNGRTARDVARVTIRR